MGGGLALLGAMRAVLLPVGLARTLARAVLTVALLRLLPLVLSARIALLAATAAALAVFHDLLLH
jgi:hypothetical protein